MAPAKKHIYLVPKNPIFIEKNYPPEKVNNYLILLMNFYISFYKSELYLPIYATIAFKHTGFSESLSGTFYFLRKYGDKQKTGQKWQTVAVFNVP